MRRSAVGVLLTPWAFGRSESNRVECFHQTNPFSGRRGWRVSVFDVYSCELRKSEYLFFPVQRENIGLQAKRLGWLLDIPLTSAKEILARGPYRCDSWIDLESRVDSGMAGPRMISLSLVGSEPSAMTFLTVISMK